jgi:hypothetical protein
MEKMAMVEIMYMYFISKLCIYGMFLDSLACSTLVSEFTFPSIVFSSIVQSNFQGSLGGMYRSLSPGSAKKCLIIILTSLEF